MNDFNSHAPIELINIVPFNPLISKCQIKVCWVGYQPNRNKSIITKDVAREMANSLPGSPIVGHFNENNGDFEEHNKVIKVAGGKIKLEPDTKPYGFVDLNAKVWFQWFQDYDGVTREYLVTVGWLWTGQFPECARVITEGNNHSMELSENPNYLDAYWSKDQNGNKEFFIINEAIISKLCILGEEFEPCFEGGSIEAPKIEFSLEDSFKEQLLSMMTELTNILNEGGAKMVTDKDNIIVEPTVDPAPAVDPVVETPVVEEPAEPATEPVVDEPAVDADPVVDPVAEFADNKKDDEEEKTCPKCGKPLGECECEDKKEDDEEDKKKKEYVLEEIPEYVELQSNYASLETKYNELLGAHETLKNENSALAEFKANADKKEKEALIASFYMLSDELKKDVVDNIDTYSLNDIEAKLSILCVRNKVSFDLENDKETDPISYNLNDTGSSNDNVPEWIKAIQSHVAEN